MKTCHVITRMIVGGARKIPCSPVAVTWHPVIRLRWSRNSPGRGELLTRDCPEGLQVVTFPQLVRELSPLKDWQAYCKLRHSSKPRTLASFTPMLQGWHPGTLRRTAANVPLIVPRYTGRLSIRTKASRSTKHIFWRNGLPPSDATRSSPSPRR